MFPSSLQGHHGGRRAPERRRALTPCPRPVPGPEVPLGNVRTLLVGSPRACPVCRTVAAPGPADRLLGGLPAGAESAAAGRPAWLSGTQKLRRLLEAALRLLDDGRTR